MALATIDDLIDGLANSYRINFGKSSITAVSGILYSLWAAAGTPGAGSNPGNTANGIVPTDATAGAPTIPTFTNTGYLAGAASIGVNTTGIIVYDRLFHAGPYTLTAGTTNLTSVPSYSSRVPGGDYTGCEAWLEMTTVNSAANTTVNLGYTNQAGTNSRTTSFQGNLNAAPVNQMRRIDLQAGDTGVQSVQSVIIATSGTGACNIMILRRIAFISCQGQQPPQDFAQTGLPVVFSDSCLMLAAMPNTTSTGVIEVDLNLIDK